MSPHLPSADLHRLISEELANDDNAVRQVEQLIQQLREQQRAAQQWQQAAWQPAAPEWCDYGRIPHC